MTTISTYRGPITNFKTMVIVGNKKPFGEGYKEAQITFKGGQMFYIITDGFKYLTIEKPVRNNLKSAINIVEYYLLEDVLEY
jgi:hypothetical protein